MVESLSDFPWWPPPAASLVGDVVISLVLATDGRNCGLKAGKNTLESGA